MNEVNWFERGALGERVLNVVESYIDGYGNRVQEDLAVGSLREMGLSDDEIYDLFDNEGYSVRV
jgi:hypothetical protein